MKKDRKDQERGTGLPLESSIASVPALALNKATQKTLRVIAYIHDYYPELAVFMNEMNDSYAEVRPGEPPVNVLDRYCDSLLEIVKNYTRTHPVREQNEVRTSFPKIHKP